MIFTSAEVGEVVALCDSAGLKVLGGCMTPSGIIAVMVERQPKQNGQNIANRLKRRMGKNDIGFYSVTFSEGLGLNSSFLYFSPEQAVSHE